MRRILPATALLLLGACTTRPLPAPVEQQQQAPPSEHTRGGLIGLTPEQLVERFGSPALQIREGNSWKLQFRSASCVLDAYLYPAPGQQTPYRVTYVDTRTRSLNSINQLACIASLEP